MKKSYLFYGVVGAAVAFDYLYGYIGGATAQTFVEVAPVEPELLEPKAVSESLGETIDAVFSILCGVVWVGIMYKIFYSMLKP